MLRPLLAITLAAVLGGATRPHATLRSFHLPSGNVGCIADDEVEGWELRCDISERSWRGPARPRNCDLDYGDALAMAGTGRPYWVCHGDTVLGQGPVLRYGQSWRAGPFTCLSQVAGLTCSNRNGHGFFLSRASYRVF
jgi:uncharacterized protein DUF6636